MGNFISKTKNSVHRTGVGPLKASSGELVLDDQEKADLLNSYFVSACIEDNGVLPPLPNPATDNESVLDLITHRTDQIKRILKKLKNKSSSGPDGLPAILFHNLAAELAYPLAKIYNLFMLAGSVPKIWKQAR